MKFLPVPEDQLAGKAPAVLDSSAHLRCWQPMVRTFGFGPQTATCNKCRHGQDVEARGVITQSGSNATYGMAGVVCAFRGETHCPRAVVAPHAPSCARYEAKEVPA